MKALLLLVKPAAAIAVLSSVTFHATRTEPLAQTRTEVVPGQGEFRVPPETTTERVGWCYHVTPDLAGQHSGFAAMGRAAGRMDLVSLTTRMREMDDDDLLWRPWMIGMYPGVELFCDEPAHVEQLDEPAEADYATRVRAYQTACLTPLPKPADPDPHEYGLRLRASELPPPTESSLAAFIRLITDIEVYRDTTYSPLHPQQFYWADDHWTTDPPETTINWDSLERAQRQRDLEDLIRAVDSVQDAWHVEQVQPAP